MKYYSYFDLNGIHTLSEEEIIKEYWNYWCEKMEKKGIYSTKYSYKDCIMDWKVLHWAFETDSKGNY